MTWLNLEYVLPFAPKCLSHWGLNFDRGSLRVFRCLYYNTIEKSFSPVKHKLNCPLKRAWLSSTCDIISRGRPAAESRYTTRWYSRLPKKWSCFEHANSRIYAFSRRRSSHKNACLECVLTIITVPPPDLGQKRLTFRGKQLVHRLLRNIQFTWDRHAYM